MHHRQGAAPAEPTARRRIVELVADRPVEAVALDRPLAGAPDERDGLYRAVRDPSTIRRPSRRSPGPLRSLTRAATSSAKLRGSTATRSMGRSTVGWCPCPTCLRPPSTPSPTERHCSLPASLQVSVVSAVDARGSADGVPFFCQTSRSPCDGPVRSVGLCSRAARRGSSTAAPCSEPPRREPRAAAATFSRATAGGCGRATRPRARARSLRLARRAAARGGTSHRRRRAAARSAGALSVRVDLRAPIEELTDSFVFAVSGQPGGRRVSRWCQAVRGERLLTVSSGSRASTTSPRRGPPTRRTAPGVCARLGTWTLCAVLRPLTGLRGFLPPAHQEGLVPDVLIHRGSVVSAGSGRNRLQRVRSHFVDRCLEAVTMML